MPPTAKYGAALYMRVTQPTEAAIREIAEQSGLSLAKVIDTLIATTLGTPKFAPGVDLGPFVRAYKAAHKEA